MTTHVTSGPSPSSGPEPDEPEIVALVNRAIQRDRVAFAALYDRMLEPVYRYVFYRTGSQSDAEDLCEQVFLQAWAAIDRFRWQGRPFRSWLYTLAHNLLIDYRRQARPVHSLNDDDRPLDIASPRGAGEFNQLLDAQMLASAISTLTHEQQQVIALRFVEGFPTAEVAALMNKREGTIRALQLRALLSLRRYLERQGERGSK